MQIIISRIEKQDIDCGLSKELLGKFYIIHTDYNNKAEVKYFDKLKEIDDYIEKIEQK